MLSSPRTTLLVLATSIAALVLPAQASAAGLAVNITARPPLVEDSRATSIAWTVHQGRSIATGVSIACRIDGRAFRTCASPMSLIGQPQGKHSFVVTATKRVDGRTLSGAAVVNWTVDTVRPGAPAVKGGGAAWSASAVAVTASGSAEAGSGIKRYDSQLSADNGATWSTVTRAGASRTISTPGATRVRFRAVDNAGNHGVFLTTSARVDNVPPTVPTVSGGSSSWSNAATRSIVATSSDSYSGVHHLEFATSSDGGATWSALQVGSTATISAEGTTLVRFRAVDAVGNTSGYSISPIADATVKLDRAAPTGTLAGVPTWSVGAITTINGTHADLSGVASWYVRYAGGPTPTDFCTSAAASPWSCPNIDTTSMTNGSYTVQLWATDVAGNAGLLDSAPTTVDNGTPVGTASFTSEVSFPQYQHAVGTQKWFNSGHAGSFTVTVAASDPSGIASVTFPALGTLWTGGGVDTSAPYVATYTWAVGAAAPGAVTALITDNSAETGNAPFTITDDTTAPSPGTVTYTAGYTTADTSLVVAAASDASGVASWSVDRRSAPLADDVCSPWSAWAPLGAITTTGAHSDATSDFMCYQYSYVATDNVGNVLDNPGGTLKRRNPVTLSLTGGPVDIVENGASSGYVVSLSAPQGGVTHVTSTTTAPHTTFNPSNPGSFDFAAGATGPQQVYVIPVDTQDCDPDGTYSIDVEARDWANVLVASASIPMTRDDTMCTNIVVDDGNGDVAEAGAGNDVCFHLDAQPARDVTVTGAFATNTDATVSGPVTWTTVDWATSKCFTIDDVDDSLDEAAETDQFSLQVAPQYAALAPAPLTVNITDNDYTDTYVSGTMAVDVDAPGTTNDGPASIWAPTSPVPDASWIATKNGPFVTGPFIFTSTFVVPVGATNRQVVAYYVGDDRASATINGVGPSASACYNCVPGTYSQPLLVGTNTLRFDVPNSSGNGGMAFKAVVTYSL
jgi:hypothetical protein